MTFVKEMDAIEALEFWSRLTHRCSAEYQDHNMSRRFLKNYLKRTGQTELLDMHGLHEWLKQPGLEKKTFKIELTDVNCRGNRNMVEYLIGTHFARV